MDFSVSSRSDKTYVLEEIINNLHIGKEEKELYLFSMEILDDDNFERFFRKIMNDFSEKTSGVHFVQQ